MSFRQLRHDMYWAHSVPDMTERRIPKLMGAAEIQARLGYSRQWTASLINRKGFPEPVDELSMGRVWLASDVEDWITQHRAELAEDAETD